MASTDPKPSHFSCVSITKNNLGTVRRLNSVLFPIRYSEKFYSDILLPAHADFCKIILYRDVPVGTICCRLEHTDAESKLYLMTMGILAPYRSRKLGSQSLELVLAAAAAATISRIYLHVQESNTEAKRFYERNGFQEVFLDPEYYKKIVPRGAWILERTIEQKEELVVEVIDCT